MLQEMNSNMNNTNIIYLVTMPVKFTHVFFHFRFQFSLLNDRTLMMMMMMIMRKKIETKSEMRKISRIESVHSILVALNIYVEH